MNKKKFSKMKRFFAILGVVVILAAFALPFTAGAWELTDVPFYNYLNTELFLPSKNDGINAYVVSSDAESGTIRCSFKYSGVHTYYVPWQYTHLKLSSLCPEMVAGETYVLSGELSYITAVDNANEVKLMQLCDADGKLVHQWRYGEAVTITSEMLDAYVVIFVANFKDSYSAPNTGDIIVTELKLWINKDEAQDFAPYDLFGFYKDEIYNDIYNEGYTNGSNDGYDEGYEKGSLEGYEKGYDEGFEDYVTDHLIVSKSNVTFTPYFADYSANSIVKGSIYGSYRYDAFDYPFNGYSFRTTAIPEKYLAPIEGSDKFAGFDLELVPEKQGIYYAVGDSKFSFAGSFCHVTLNVGVEVDGEYVVKTLYFDLGEDEVVNIDWKTDFGLIDNQMIYGLSFGVRMYAPLFEDSKWEYFTFSFTDMSGEGYEIGRKDGYDIGLAEGEKNGYDNGRKDGFDAGYSSGAAEGVNVGVERGKEIGYAEGYAEGIAEGETLGYNKGYDKGHNKGYYEGIAEQQEETDFYELIYAVVDAPVSVLSKTFNFNLMGVNMGDFFFGLVTFAATASLAIFILKLVK